MEVKDMIAAIVEGKRKKIKRYPQYVTRSSEVGHPCERYLVYSVTNWQDRAMHDPGLQFVFEGGNMVEDMAIRDFEEAGFKVYRPEPTAMMSNTRPAITGHLDFRVDFGDGKPVTIECKGLSKYDWDYLNTYEDFFTSKKMYIRKYPGQIQMYMYFKAEDLAYFYLKSIPGFQPKLIPVKLDYAYVESILQKTERVEKHIAAGTFPPQIDDVSVCEKCGFLALCLPSIKRQPMEIINDAELEAMLKRWEEIKPLYQEWQGLDHDLKKSFEGSERLMIGEYLVTGKLIQRKGYMPKPVESSSYWKYDISHLEVK